MKILDRFSSICYNKSRKRKGNRTTVSQKLFGFSKPPNSGRRAVYFFIDTISNNTIVRYNMYSIKSYHPHSRLIIIEMAANRSTFSLFFNCFVYYTRYDIICQELKLNIMRLRKVGAFFIHKIQNKGVF